MRNEEALAQFSQQLQEHGYRLTPARRAIITSLLATGGHLSADQLAEQVHQTSPTVGRMTVYRTLDLLCQLGLLRTVYQGTGAAHYILLESGHHHHLICDQCHLTIEFDECTLEGLSQKLAEEFGFHIAGHLVEFYGLCPACKEQGA
jgi:Fur family transcriptional regulator, ferric uptake regulator